MEIVGFKEGVARAMADGVVGVDTEFVWTKTYYPILGLVQFGTADGDAFFLDPLDGSADKQALAGLMANPGVVKVLCDAHQDLWILSRYCGAAPANIFDIRHAAGFAGMQASLSLRQLVLDFCGIELQKSETQTDWTQRPLTDAQVRYAAEDVIYLGDIRRKMIAKAEGFGTLDYFMEDMKMHEDPAEYAGPDIGEVWRKVRGASRVGARGRGILKVAAAFREKCAMRMDIPRNWLIPDEVLISIAEHPPREKTDLERINKMPHRRYERFGFELFNAVRNAAAQPGNDCAEGDAHRGRIPADELKAKVDEALAYVKERGAERHIDPPLIASRAAVASFVASPGDPGQALAKGWRWQVAGEHIASML